jgi:short-subunit dehydrogenase
VKVSVVCPGYVRTKIFDTAVMVNMPQELANRAPGRIKMVEAAQAARVILDGVARNRAVIAFPGYIRWAWRTSCLFPRRPPADPGYAELPDSLQPDMTPAHARS